MLSLILAAALLSDPVATPVSLPTERAPLHGTLLTPSAPRAVAVIVPGSGPTDRDGNSPLGVSGGIYRQLAEGLAERGVASLRFDKRGIAASAFAASDEASLRFDHYVEDARRWAALAAERTGQPCAWLIGHSEGALIAQKAAEGDDTVCGLVLVSAVGQKAGDQIRQQLATLPEPLNSQAMAALTDLEAGRATEGPPELAALFRPSVQPYLISYLALDPVALIAAYAGPVLLVHGTTDLQVPIDNSERLAAAQPAARLVRIEGANHVLRIAPAERAANAATYNDAALPLASGIVDAVADFILQPR